MLRALTSLFSSPAYQAQSHALYVRVVEKARQPVFYTEYAVPDTLDGRFDMIALQMFFIVERLKKDGSPEALEFLRAVSEVFFSDMDRSIREMGSTDTGVVKRMKNISQAFYGRIFAYETSAGDDAKMQDALLRNLYRSDLSRQAEAVKMADYVEAQRTAYRTLRLNDLLDAALP